MTSMVTSLFLGRDVSHGYFCKYLGVLFLSLLLWE